MEAGDPTDDHFIEYFLDPLKSQASQKILDSDYELNWFGDTGFEVIKGGEVIGVMEDKQWWEA